MKLLPYENIDDDWADIFSEMSLNGLPVAYMSYLVISFRNEKIWKVGIPTISNRNPLSEVQAHLYEILDTYANNIAKIEAKIDAKKVQYTVEKAVKKLCKKLKI